MLISSAFSDCRQMYLSFHYVEGAEVEFEMEEFLYGEDNCCDEYPISFCEEGTIYYEKEDYADLNDIENWDVISANVALLRGDNQMLYNPMIETSYGNGSPQNTLWKRGAAYSNNAFGGTTPYANAGVLNIIYIPKYLPGTIGSFYSIPDNQYYDIHFISWTSGGGTGWPGGGGDGDGGGGGGGVGYWRSGPVNVAPRISQIIDVPSDQGGRVYITINRSTLDLEDHPSGLDIYTVQRLDSGNWVEIGSFGAQYNTQYIFEATTLQDSSSQNFELSTFKVVAQNFIYDFIFESEPEFGFSIDNIAPGVPYGLMMALNENNLELTWNEVSDEDFQYYVIERDNTLEFSNPQIYETVEPYFLVSDYNSEQDYFYRLYAVDYAGNSSGYSNILDATALSNQDLTVPNSFFLHQNYPNPFNPNTRINYDMPNGGNVLIKISDVKGNHVTTLVDDYVQMGLQFIVWDARNNNGEKVPAGIYFYTFKVNDFLQTQKMILLK
jgi:hypothetical protein